MGQRDSNKAFETEQEAQEYADKEKASAVPGYSEVYVSGPYKSSVDNLWHVNTKVYYG
jgi:hypothetical protein